jgi:hypothetical protein
MEPITTIEVTLSRVINEDGHMSVKLTTPCHYNAVEVLGLLEAGKMQIFRDMGEL